MSLIQFSTNFVENFFYIIIGEIMKVKIFDEEDEKDLESAINSFLEDFDKEIVDIKYQVSSSIFGEEQIYCFSAMIVYLK